MKKYWCKKCGDQHGYFHSCFRGKASKRYRSETEMKRHPDNTPLARRLAKLYEEAFNEPFPLGIGNAQVFRDQLAINCFMDGGAWSWSLVCIELPKGGGGYRAFGSCYPATECAKDKTKLMTTGLFEGCAINTEQLFEDAC